MFAIEFDGEPWIDEDGPWRKVKLTLDGSMEGECADLTHWSPEDYERQWLRELRAIVFERNRGALIVCIHDPSRGERVTSWTMWRKDQQIVFQNRLLFKLDICSSFRPERVVDHIGEYRAFNEDGRRLSEWSVPISSVRSFSQVLSSQQG